MVQRLALAQALLTEPDVLVLDEPLEGLDLDGRTLLQEIIVEQRRAGKLYSSFPMLWVKWPACAIVWLSWSRAISLIVGRWPL